MDQQKCDVKSNVRSVMTKPWFIRSIFLTIRPYHSAPVLLYFSHFSRSALFFFFSSRRLVQFSPCLFCSALSVHSLMPKIVILLGICSHWKYKGGGKKKALSYVSYQAWQSCAVHLNVPFPPAEIKLSYILTLKKIVSPNDPSCIHSSPATASPKTARGYWLDSLGVPDVPSSPHLPNSL